MSTEREEAEAVLARTRADLAKNCSQAVMAAAFGEDRIGCKFWRSVEAECHDPSCLLEASKIRPWSCGPDDRSVVTEAVAKARRAL